MHRKTSLTLSLLVALVIAAPSAALAQSGGLDEYQEGAPTAGGEQSGVPGGTSNSGGGGNDNGGQSGGSDSSDPAATEPSVSPTTPTTDPGSSSSPSGGGADGSASNSGPGSGSSANTSNGAPGNGSQPASRAGAAGGAEVAPTASPVVTATTPVAETADGGSNGSVVLAIAIVLLLVGVGGTVLYRRKYGTVTAPRAAAIARHSAA